MFFPGYPSWLHGPWYRVLGFNLSFYPNSFPMQQLSDSRFAVVKTGGYLSLEGPDTVSLELSPGKPIGKEEIQELTLLFCNMAFLLVQKRRSETPETWIKAKQLFFFPYHHDYPSSVCHIRVMSHLHTLSLRNCHICFNPFKKIDFKLSLQPCVTVASSSWC